MNMLEYAREQSSNVEMPSVCQFCGKRSDELDLYHLVKPCLAKIKMLMRKLDLTYEQAEAVFDFYGINTVFSCPKCRQENIDKVFIKVFDETHLRIYLYSSRFLKQSYGISVKTIESLTALEDRTESILENVEQTQYSFQKLWI